MLERGAPSAHGWWASRGDPGSPSPSRFSAALARAARRPLCVLLAGLAGMVGAASLVLTGTAAAQAQPQVTVTVDTTAHGSAIPAGFSGLSFETGSERPGNARVAGYFFSPQNTALVTLFQNLGIKNLRMGGGSVDDEIPPGMGSDGYAGIDNLFAFARAAGVKVIYSLRLLDPAKNPIAGLAPHDAAIAQHIAQYQPYLYAFAIGNEPDWNSYHHSDPLIQNYPTYLADWTHFADTIRATVPGALFVGPDTGAYTTATYYNGESWTQRFAADVGPTGLLAAVTQHDYVGAGPGKTTAQQAIDDMLSPQWVDGTQIAAGPQGTSTYTPYPWLYANNLAPVVQDGLPYRITEANDYLGGVAGASNAFASALWALDYMHWWAEHGAAGVNFHNKQWILTDTIVPSPNPCASVCGNFQTTPKGYGIKAFSLGGHGYVEPVAISNPDNVDVTAYAVGSSRDVYVTVINKTQGAGARPVRAVIVPRGLAAASVASMTLTDGVPGNAALLTATLGGAAITDSGRWTGAWTPLSPDTAGRLTVTVQAATAVILHLQAAGAYDGPVQINRNGTLELVADGTSGTVAFDRQTAPGGSNSAPAGWNGWADIPGGVATQGSPALVHNLNNTLQVFATTGAGAVYTDRQATPGGAWTGWQSLGGPGITHVAAARNADGSLSAFGIGPDGTVWVDSQGAPGVGWSGWSDLGGHRIEPGFAIGRNLDGRLVVFGMDRHAQVWYDQQNSQDAWSGWQPLGTAGKGPRLAVGRNLDGRLQLFGVGSGGALWSAWQETPGGPWHAWTDLGGKGLAPGVAVGQDNAGRLVVFGVQARTGDVLSLTQRARAGGRGWGDWSDLGRVGTGAGQTGTVAGQAGTEAGQTGTVAGQAGAAGGAGPVTAPRLAVGNTAGGGMQIFALYGDGAVWSDWQQQPGGWSGWTPFGSPGAPAR